VVMLVRAYAWRVKGRGGAGISSRLFGLQTSKRTRQKMLRQERQTRAASHASHMPRFPFPSTHTSAPPPLPQHSYQRPASPSPALIPAPRLHFPSTHTGAPPRLKISGVLSPTCGLTRRIGVDSGSGGATSSTTSPRPVQYAAPLLKNTLMSLPMAPDHSSS
jgi:hypothetical protein